jgi:hypothetical protein
MWVQVGVAAGVIAAAAGVYGVTVARQGDGGTRAEQTTDYGCNVNGQDNTVTCGAGVADPEPRILAQAAANRDVPPRGDGPWPFAVVHDGGIGLKVRTTNVEQAIHIGGMAHAHTAWVMCKEQSGFDPEGFGDLWYKVKWDNQTGSTAFFESDIAAHGSGWAHSYYLAPINFNGAVPYC